MNAARSLLPRARWTAAAATALGAASSAAFAATTTTTPFRGVVHHERNEPAGVVAPRQVVMHIVEIDLTDPYIDFLATPGNGAAPGEFTAQTTSQFAQEHATQIAVNGDYFQFVSYGPNGERYKGTTLYLFTVDGRQPGWSEGMTLVETPTCSRTIMA
jgi:hypothetical protein